MAPAKKTVPQSVSKRGEGAAAKSLTALDMLGQDHREVEDLFQQFEAARTDKDAVALKICLALQVHAQIEEEIFYPAAREAIEDSKLIDEAIVEHASAKRLIAETEAMEEGDAWEAKVTVLAEQIRHHVDEEEDELFPQLRQTSLDLRMLGQRLAARKSELLQAIAEGADQS